MRNTKNSSKHNSGFTLLEIIVAVTITTLLAAIVMNVFLSSSRNQQVTHAIVNSHEAARTLTQVLSQDLSNARVTTISASNQVARPNGVPFGAILQTSTGNITYQVSPEGVLTRTDQAGNTRPIAMNIGTLLFTGNRSTRLLNVHITMNDSPYEFQMTRFLRSD